MSRSGRLPAAILGSRNATPAPSDTLPKVWNKSWPVTYLDNFDQVPAYAEHPRITPLRSQDHGRLYAAGKFLGLTLCAGARYYMTFDDDIYYPPDFSYRLKRAHRASGRGAFGVHGSVFSNDVRSFSRDRTAFDAPARLWFSSPVQVLATCGTLHAVDELCFDVREWELRNMVDLCFAFEPKNAGVPLGVKSRHKGWIRRLEDMQEDSIFLKLLADDSVQTRLVRELLGQPALAPPPATLSHSGSKFTSA